MKRGRFLSQLSAGHFLIDSYSSMLPAFLPFLHRELGLTLGEAGLAAGVLTVSAALMQPVYGFLADRWQSGLFVALAPATAAVFISVLGLVETVPQLLLAVFLGGVGIASFHPQAAALVTANAGVRKGFSLSIFFGSGMLGYAIGPVSITLVIGFVGLGNSYWAALPGVAMTCYLLAVGKVGQRARQEPAPRADLWSLIAGRWRPLFRLYVLVVIRSVVQMVFVAFLPLYFTSLGHTNLEASSLLTVFLLAGGTASLFGGSLADRIGGGRVILISMAGLGPCLLGFLYSGGLTSIVLCAAAGGFLLLTTPVNIAMAQKLVPGGSGTVSALMMGFAWGVGGLLVPVVGVVSETWGLGPVLAVVALVTVPGIFLSLPLAGAQDRPETLEPERA